MKASLASTSRTSLQSASPADPPRSGLGFGVWDLGFGVWGLGFGI